MGSRRFAVESRPPAELLTVRFLNICLETEQWLAGTESSRIGAFAGHPPRQGCYKGWCAHGLATIRRLAPNLLSCPEL